MIKHFRIIIMMINLMKYFALLTQIFSTVSVFQTFIQHMNLQIFGEFNLVTHLNISLNE